MKNYLVVALLLSTLLFTGCQRADVIVTEEPPASVDNNGQSDDKSLSADIPTEWAKVVVTYEKDGRIMLAKGDTSPQILIDELEASHPLLSPNGKHVLFTVSYYDKREGFDGEYEGSYFDLWLANLDDGTTRPFVTEEMLKHAKDLPIGKYLPWLVTDRATWLNSGDRIAFISYGIAHVWNFDNNDLRIADLVTDEVIELLPDEMGGNFAFSPDGASLFVANSSSVSLIDASGGQRLEVLTFEGFGAEYESSYIPQPVWAPDNSYGLIALLNPDSYYPYNHFESLKSADSFQKAGNVEIWKINLDGSAEKLFNIHWPTVDELMSGSIFSPDRRYTISSLKGDLVSESRLINLEGETIATFNYFSEILSWSPNSQMLIVRNNDELTMLWADGREEAFPYTSAPKWISPNAFLVLKPVQEEENDLWLIDLDGRAKLIDTGAINEFDALLID